jgi:ribonuclease E
MVLESNRDLVLRRVVECLSRDRTKHQVAEVTSLGLVQMTRKKLGLGLVESFSENCEVCAGRGIIIHHDPVFKHRSPEPIGSSAGSPNGSTSSRGRRGRGGAGGGQSSQSSVKNGVGSTGTHAITEDVRNALAQIAKSTVPHVEHDHTEHAHAEHAHAESGEPSGAEAPSGIVRVQAPEAAEPADEAPVEILDIPVPVVKGSRSSRRISTQDAEQLLGSVLGALPEPKQAGQGRVRASRRASSAGAVVRPSEVGE